MHQQTTADHQVQSRYAAHKLRWEHCTRCPLHQTRKRVVLYRGQLPCDVLFVGEAPGRSEDLIGLPFVGEAGRLLDGIIKEAMHLPIAVSDPFQAGFLTSKFSKLRIAFTNIVCCLPTTNGEPRAPNKGEADKCSPRFREMVEIADPQLLVTLGQVAQRHLTCPDSVARLHLIHPAAILRQDPKQQALSYKRCVLSLSRALGELK